MRILNDNGMLCQAVRKRAACRVLSRGMGNESATVRSVVGENVRRWREEAGASQDDLATKARAVGLRWTRSKVAALERGEKSIGVEDLVLLAEAIGGSGEPATVADLLAGEGSVRLSDQRVLYRESLRRFLSGAPVSVLVKDVPGGIERRREAMKSAPAMFDRMVQLAGPETEGHLAEHAEKHAGEAEERAGRALGLNKIEVAYLSVGLWGCTLAEERDRRVGGDVPAASRSARRGRETRKLINELRVRLAEVENAER